MRNYLLALFLLLCTATGNAQQYQYVPMPTEDAQWRYSTVGWAYNIVGWSELLLRVDGSDTVVNNYVYKKIICRRFDTSDVTDPFDAHVPDKQVVANKPEYLYGLMREDSMKVYYRSVYNNFVDTTERLLYDFTLSIGDTVNTVGIYPPYGYQSNFIVTGIDTVLMNGAYRRRLICTMGNYDTMAVIEGIGSDRGLLNANMYFRAFSYFTCLTYKGYMYAPEGKECSYIWPYGTPTAINEIAVERELNIYPNPFSNELNIKSDKQVITTIFGVAGNKVLQSDQAIISTPHLSSGVYMIVVKDNKGDIVHRQKLIKE